MLGQACISMNVRQKFGLYTRKLTVSVASVQTRSELHTDLAFRRYTGFIPGDVDPYPSSGGKASRGNIFDYMLIQSYHLGLFKVPISSPFTYFIIHNKMIKCNFF